MRADLERLAARTLCVGFEGAKASPQVLSSLAALQPAGIVLFSRNVHDVDSARRLVERVREACEEGLPLLVAVDQEGGPVARLRRDAVELPSAMALAACDDQALCERAGRAVARDLRRAGMNVDFAPVLDVASDPRNTVIGTRSFGDDPERVARLGLAFARGLEDAGVAATAKHFPGHGDTEIDSHDEMPTIAAPVEVLRARDLLPFARAAEAGVSAIMTAHVRVPALDPGGLPATLSRRLLTGVLRGELGFSGVCVTDSLEMGALSGGIGSERGAIEALRAGADLLLVSHSLPLAQRIAQVIARAAGEGSLPLARLEEAVARVDALRARLRAQPPLPPEDPQVGVEAARRSLVAYRGEPQRWEPGSDGVVVELGSEADAIGAVEGGRRAPRLCALLRARGVDAREIGVAEAAAGAARVAVLLRRAQHDPAQLDVARALLAERQDALLIVAREPYDAALFPQARRVVCTFGDEPVSLAALADAMTGAFPVTGRMPVALPLP